MILSAVLISSLAVGVGTALAQDDSSSQPTNPPAQTWGFRGPGGPMMGEGRHGRFSQQEQFGPRGPMMGQMPFGMGGPMADGALHDLVEEYTGLDQVAMHAARLNGQTLADLITANSQSVDDFIAAAVEQASTRIDALVEAGRITSGWADQLKAQMESGITAMVNGEFGGMRLGGMMFGGI
jgi:hypothetical protein